MLSAPRAAARAAPRSLRCPTAAAPVAKALRRAPRGMTAVRAFQESEDKAPEAAAVAMTFSLQHKVGMVMGAASCDKRRSNLRRNGWMLVWLLC